MVVEINPSRTKPLLPTLRTKGGAYMPRVFRSSITFFVIIFSKITTRRIIVWVLGVFLATNREFRIYGSSVKILDANEGLGHFYPK